MNRVFYYMSLIFIVTALVLANIEEDDYDEEEDDYLNTNSSTNGSLIFVKELTNSTRDPGKTVRLICEVQNLDVNNTRKVTFSWRKNEAPIDLQDKRIKIRTSKDGENKFKSMLKISNLDFFDRSSYECRATNGLHKIKSQCYLDVTSDTSKYGSTAINAIDIEDYEDLDEKTTFLPNVISKQDRDLFLNSKTRQAATFDVPIQFDLTPTGKVVENYPIYNSSEPFCQIYQGRICNQYLDGKYVFVQPPFTQADIEDKLERAYLVVSQSNDLSSSCNKFAHPSLCFSAFPICLDPKQINMYQTSNLDEFKTVTENTKHILKNMRLDLTNSLRRICREDCMVLENELCSKEYAIGRRHPVIGKIMELEECENLPKEDEESSNHCLGLGVSDLNVDREDKCYWDSGTLYRGVQDVTISNTKCLRWSHQFHIAISEHPELTGHNYCRNPGGIESAPFCFVDQNRKETCGINKCVYVFGFYVMMIVFTIAVVIGTAISYFYCRRKNKIARNLQNKDLPVATKNIYGNPGPSSPMEMNTLLPPNLPPQRNHHNSNKNSIQSVPQYTYKEVRFLDELGEGAFGKVYKGELKTKSNKIFVAVKSLKANANAKTQADFQREIELIAELKHPNIICLLGVVMKQEPMCMLFEFMSEGDLHEFLISNSPGEGKSLTHDQFLHIAIQIALGMEYLSENHYVHRDLAARNCLVSKDMVVKISDFGLSRDMYSCDYYRVQSKSLLPVRWMPPESILYGKFTTESDVWSYGVVLWEIYSYGLQPYYGQNNQEVINMIRSRKLLPCPDACPSYCYSLMVECWAEQAMRRPNFSEIAHRLKVWKQSGSSNGAYYKTAPLQPTPQKYGHGSKSSHTSDSQTLCPTAETPMTSFTWEREHNKPSPSNRLHDSQSSLTSRSSSLGNNTQSTGISTDHRRERKHRKNNDSLDRLNPKTIVVNSTGDNYETKISL